LGRGVFEGSLSLEKTPVKKALFFLLLLLSACFPKKERPLFEACFYFEELPKIMGQILEEPKGLKGNFSLRISNEKGSFVIRGKFLYQEKEGLWALGLDPWGSELFQVWIRDEAFSLFYSQKKVFFLSKFKGGEICLLVEEGVSKFSKILSGKLRGLSFRLILSELEETRDELPKMDLHSYPSFFISDLWSLIFGPSVKGEEGVE
jgi:hypothetical protein